MEIDFPCITFHSFIPSRALLMYVLWHYCQHIPFYTEYPAELSCLGSPAASNVPLGRTRIRWAVLCPGATQVTLCPRAFMEATVALSKEYSKVTWFGISWSCRRGLANALAAESPRSMELIIVCTVAVRIRLPPADPAIKNSLPLGRSTIAGVMEERGRFPGRT